MSEIKTARITDTMFGREDHGILTFMIFVEMNDSRCGIGGYALDWVNAKSKQRIYEGRGLEAISRILSTVGVRQWEDLTGKYIRVKDEGWGKPIYEIGNIIKEDWFNLKDFFEGKTDL